MPFVPIARLRLLEKLEAESEAALTRAEPHELKEELENEVFLRKTAEKQLFDAKATIDELSEIVSNLDIQVGGLRDLMDEKVLQEKYLERVIQDQKVSIETLTNTLLRAIKS